MTEYVSSEKTVERDAQGNLASTTEVLTDTHGRCTRVVKTLVRDSAGNLSGVVEMVEPAGWSPAALERQRERLLARHRAERFTRQARMRSATECTRAADGTFTTRARSAIGGG